MHRYFHSWPTTPLVANGFCREVGSGGFNAPPPVPGSDGPTRPLDCLFSAFCLPPPLFVPSCLPQAPTLAELVQHRSYLPGVGWHNSLHWASGLEAGVDMPYSTSATVPGQCKQHLSAQESIWIVSSVEQQWCIRLQQFKEVQGYQGSELHSTRWSSMPSFCKISISLDEDIFCWISMLLCVTWGTGLYIVKPYISNIELWRTFLPFIILIPINILTTPQQSLRQCSLSSWNYFSWHSCRLAIHVIIV